VTEPELASGDSGEHVTELQTRLKALGRYPDAIDGIFGPRTEAAVVDLQQDRGLAADGRVGPRTWSVLAEAEVVAGLAVPTTGLVPGALSEDQQWRWDGDGWQPTAELAGAAAQPDEPPVDRQVSGDGQWVWNGSGWQPVQG
jgi:peptidoglycan hydrolase-like protein with peptidoglycan-binding domain